MNVFKKQYLDVPTSRLEKFFSNFGHYNGVSITKKRFFAGRIAKVFKNK